jgi:rRNA maturation endonuclease Nob1
LQVSAKEEIVIKDSCIIIDLIELGLIDIFFGLGLVVYTTPNVLGEITEPDQAVIVKRLIVSGQLKIEGTGSFATISSIASENLALSFADSSVLELAIRLKATVLTSDGSLRKVTLSKEIKVRGCLWIIEELVNLELITVEAALQKLDDYPKINDRSPKKEIADLIGKLKQLTT